MRFQGLQLDKHFMKHALAALCTFGKWGKQQTLILIMIFLNGSIFPYSWPNSRTKALPSTNSSYKNPGNGWKRGSYPRASLRRSWKMACGLLFWWIPPGNLPQTLTSRHIWCSARMEQWNWRMVGRESIEWGIRYCFIFYVNCLLIEVCDYNPSIWTLGL